MQGISERFAKAADELRLTGRQLYRDEIVANDQVLSKIKSGRQKPTKKAIELFCQKYGVSAAWMYTGEGNMYLGRSKPFGPRIDSGEEKPLYNTDFETCLDSDGQPISTGNEMLVSFPMAGDFDFMCINTDKSLAPIIMPADIIGVSPIDNPAGFPIPPATTNGRDLRPECLSFDRLSRPSSSAIHLRSQPTRKNRLGHFYLSSSGFSTPCHMALPGVF